MKKLFIVMIFSSLQIILSSVVAQTSDLTLREVLGLIHGDSLKRTVQDMQNFESRLSTKTVEGNKEVAQYLVNRLKDYGIENARVDSFYVSGNHWLAGAYTQYMYNVLGSLKGKGNTDSTVIIGAHLDAISYYKDSTGYFLTPTVPGADDNATGCAVMIEMARVLFEKKIQPFHNIDFMAYDGEELGLLGAYYDAKKRKAENEKIIVMLNNDMVGNQPNDETWSVSLRWYDNSLDVTEKAEQALYNYTDVIPVRAADANSSGSDSYAYFKEKYKVNFAIEQFFSPYYHSEGDLTKHLNFEYCREIAKMNFVLLNDYARIQLPLNIKSNISKNQNVAVFPNPASNVINIHSYSNVFVNQIDIYDISGKLIKSSQINGQQLNIINIENLSNGIYFLRILTEDAIINKKIIKK